MLAFRNLSIFVEKGYKTLPKGSETLPARVRNTSTKDPDPISSIPDPFDSIPGPFFTKSERARNTASKYWQCFGPILAVFRTLFRGRVQAFDPGLVPYQKRYWKPPVWKNSRKCTWQCKRKNLGLNKCKLLSLFLVLRARNVANRVWNAAKSVRNAAKMVRNTAKKVRNTIAAKRVWNTAYRIWTLLR